MKKRKSNKISQGKNVKVTFTAGRLTNYSGILPFYRFMKRLKIFQLLDNRLNIHLHHNKQYSTSQIIAAVTLGILSGLNRIIKIEAFSYDPLVQHLCRWLDNLRYLLGIPDKLDNDTITNRIKRFNIEQNTEYMGVIGELSGKVHKKLDTKTEIIDLDSSVKTVYGNQEGAEKGYNPKAPGKKSYHPLLAFLNSTKECILFWLRPGDAYTSNNASEFIRSVFSMLYRGLISVLVRADSGFFDNKFISAP